jgi:ABC-2 type transport system permease protein
MMKRYSRMFLALVVLSLKRFFEHRSSTYGNLSISIFWFILTILTVEIIFTQVSSIFSWTKYELLFLVGYYRLIFNLGYILFNKSIDMIPGYIKSGELDIILTKPISSMFFVTFRHTRFYEFGQLFASTILIVYAALNLDWTFSFIHILSLVLGIVSGLIIIYCLYFSIAAFAIWTVNMEALPEFQFALSQALSYPTDIYGKILNIIFVTILPLAFVVTIPVKVLLNKSPYFLSLIGFIIAVLMLVMTKYFWDYALRHYTSASS